MKVSTSVVALLSLTPAVSALAWPRWLPELDTLVVRQDNEESPASAKPTPVGNNNGNNDKSTTTSGFARITTNLNTGGIETGTKSGATVTGNSTKTSPPRKTQFNLQDPVGGVVMITPGPFAGTQLYKIGDYVTWVWNYTNVQGAPSAVDVLITAREVTRTYTLTQNMSFTETGNSYTWDTNEFQKNNIETPLVQAEYTLVIHDTDGSPTSPAEAGYLGPFNLFKFGMYEKTKYTPSSEQWKCASCSGAGSIGVDKQSMGAAMVMSALTVLSFTWFVAGFGGLL
ncbi:hypothetical protein QBC38DRAFT_138372 [Podospora fimiseda]|uniref:DUF7137 domain-containing protein n=1 Tax=Podospora fimiseda TaxID=252190 RepID=A0AAN7BGG9_9PEZI|nr:hypothetical protein QBC38DRAFT_138372 [Podospora fimiseda]